MLIVLSALASVLFVNALVAFFIAFFWQTKVFLAFFREASRKSSGSPWEVLGVLNGQQISFLQFIAGNIFPDLRRKWLKATAYVLISYGLLFAIVGLIHIVAPEVLD